MSLVLIELTNSLGVVLSTIDKDGHSVGMGLRLSRVEAQKLASALLDFADPICRRKEQAASFVGEYAPNMSAKGAIRLTPEDWRRSATRSRRGGK